MKTENEILETVFMMLLEKGFSELSTNEIIREAGLTKGGFYYAFKSREELDRRIVEKYIRPFFLCPMEGMQRAWETSKKDSTTGELLWNCFFAPQRFADYQRKIGREVAFRDFYFLVYEGMKKFLIVERDSKVLNRKKGEMLHQILRRGQLRNEVIKTLDLDNYVTMILAMQDGIRALKLLDDSIDDEEKYKRIQKQMWEDISTKGKRNDLGGGVKSAVS